MKIFILFLIYTPKNLGYCIFYSHIFNISIIRFLKQGLVCGFQFFLVRKLKPPKLLIDYLTIYPPLYCS